MEWQIDVSTQALRTLVKLRIQAIRDILQFLFKLRGMDDPRQLGKALKGGRLGSYWRYRVGDYRLIADIQDAKITVVIVHIGKRDEVYKDKS